MGVQPCTGRCRKQECPVATFPSTFEEDCIGNPDRIDQILIIDGPEALVGYGQQFWDKSQPTRDAECRALQETFAMAPAKAVADAEKACQQASDAMVAADAALHLAVGLNEASDTVSYDYLDGLNGLAKTASQFVKKVQAHAAGALRVVGKAFGGIYERAPQQPGCYTNVFAPKMQLEHCGRTWVFSERSRVLGTDHSAELKTLGAAVPSGTAQWKYIAADGVASKLELVISRMGTAELAQALEAARQKAATQAWRTLFVFLTNFSGMPTANAEGWFESEGSVGKVSVRCVLGYLQIDAGPRRSRSACSEI